MVELIVNEQQFDDKTLRVLGCLMEKELTTPENYPLTINSLMLACNQKSNRDPQMNIFEGDVGHIVKELTAKGVISVEEGSRAMRVKHKLRTHWKIDKQQQAVLSVLMLRAPQTLSDIKIRTQRTINFANLDEVSMVINSLIEHELGPFVQTFPVDAGQREQRYFHTFFNNYDYSMKGNLVKDKVAKSTDSLFNGKKLEERVAALEETVEQLSLKLKELQA